MYKIIGADRKEYGPVTTDQINTWILEGRANDETLVQAQGSTEWKPLSSCPEFAGVLAAKGASAAPLPADIFTRDYDLEIGGCVRRGWDLLKKKFGLIFGGTAVFAAIQLGISLLGQIPILGILISLGSIIIGGPLMGGLYHFFLRNIRGERTEIGDIFEGFRSHFVQLMLGYIVSLLITGVTAIPGAAILGFSFVPIVRTHQISPGAIALAVAGFVVVLVPAIFLTVTWLFSLPLIIDKRLDFWTGLETSRKVVWKHWWHVFALVLVCGLVNLGGALACCIGALVTMPITFGAMMYAYEDLFGTRPAQAA